MESEPPLPSDDTKWTGSMWLPPDRPLEEKRHWLSVPTNTLCVSAHLPACHSALSDTLYLPITSKWCVHAIDSEEFQADSSLTGAIGFKGEKDGDNSNPPEVPLCKIKTKTTEPVTWSLCRDQQPSLIDIPYTPLTVENWGAKWKVYASVGSTTVPA